jgi:hypothetical protein
LVVQHEQHADRADAAFETADDGAGARRGVIERQRFLVAAPSLYRRQRSIERGSSARVLIVVIPFRISNSKALRRPSISSTSRSFVRTRAK